MANGGIIGPVQTISQGYGADKLTTFTSGGTFNKATCNPGSPGLATVVVVAGGGGSGADGGGGGGAGGMTVTESHPLPASSVPVTVGGGGAGGAWPAGLSGDGTTSTFGSGTPLSTTGGGGGGIGGSDPERNGRPGGSGGGGRESAPGGTCAGGCGICGQGFKGGGLAAPGNGAAGGGGGKSAVGGLGIVPSAPTCGVQGGAGLDITPYLSNVNPGYSIPNSGIYAGGGAGRPGGDQNPGGGGSCWYSPTPGVPAPVSNAGTDNTGGGAGAGQGNATGGTGGSGVVLIVEKCQAIGGAFVAPGVWDMNTVYDNVKNGTWTN